MKKVSVIIPAYNAEKYIKRCLDSIIGQTYSELEIIVVNDGSTDQTKEILQQYSDSRVLIFHQENQGVSSARNRALEEASGEYIIFVDGDDYVEAEYIQKMLNAAEKKKCDLIACGYVVQDTHGKEVSAFPKRKNQFCLGLEGYVSHEEFFMGMLTHGSINSALWNKLFKKKIIGDVRFRKDIAIGEDWLFLAKIVQKSEAIYFISDKLYHYIMNPEGAMQSIQKEMVFQEKWISEWHAALDFEKMIQQQGKISNHFKNALYKKKVTIANKILNRAKKQGYSNADCEDMKAFLRYNKLAILKNPLIKGTSKVKTVLMN